MSHEGPGEEVAVSDSPDFWINFQKNKSSLDGTGLFLQHSAHITSFGNATSENYTQMCEFMESQTPSPPKEAEMNILFKAFEQLNMLRATLNDNFRKWDERNRAVAEKHKELGDKLELYHTLKKKYNTKMEKYLCSKTGTNVQKLSKMARKCLDRKSQLDFLRFEIQSLYDSLENDHKLIMTKPFVECLQSFVEMMTKGQAFVEPVKENISELAKFVAKQEESQQAKKEMIVRKQGQMSAKMQIRRTSIQILKEVSAKTAGTGIRDFDAAEMGPSAILEKEKEGQLYIPSPNFCPVWVKIKNGVLIVQNLKREADKRIPLLLCTVKELRDSKVRFVFSIVNPTQKHDLLLQAESADVLEHWLTVIQNAISYELNKPSGGDADPRAAAAEKADLTKQLETLRSVPGNDKCCDCDAPNPEWLSLNLGLMMCLTCAGVHRSMGTHISKVRSAVLDKLELTTLDYLCCIGNSNANTIWEAKFMAQTSPDGGEPTTGGAAMRGKRPCVSSNRAVREMWIKSKYELKMFLQTVDKVGDLQKSMFSHIAQGRPLHVMKMVVWGAQVNQQNEEAERRTALHEAVSWGDAACVELLLQNSGDTTAKDMRNWTPLHYAAYQNDREITHQLLSNGGPLLCNQVDIDGMSALDICDNYYPEDSVVSDLLQSQLAKLSKKTISPVNGGSFHQ